MNIQNIYARRAVLLLAFIIASSLPVASHATTGGPTYIYSFKYNPTNESVYFIQQDEGGRGCPPELLKMSLATGKIDVVFSCSQGESLMSANSATGVTPVTTAINNIVKDFKYLIPISLPKNNIAIDVDFVKSEKLSLGDDWIGGSQFTAEVFQDVNKIAEIPIVGCASDQPFVFAGYAIPGFEKRIVLLLSAKGNCFEGGYIDETLYSVENIGHLDRTQANDSSKIASPLVLSAATLVVFERDNVSTNATTTDNPVDTATTTSTAQSPKSNSYSMILLVVAAVTGALIGFILGALIFKNRRDGAVVPFSQPQ
ncbi:MAG: hypothetical protein V1711_01300 [bacterium]